MIQRKIWTKNARALHKSRSIINYMILSWWLHAKVFSMLWKSSILAPIDNSHECDLRIPKEWSKLICPHIGERLAAADDASRQMSDYCPSSTVVHKTHLGHIIEYSITFNSRLRHSWVQPHAVEKRQHFGIRTVRNRTHTQTQTAAENKQPIKHRKRHRQYFVLLKLSNSPHMEVRTNGVGRWWSGKICRFRYGRSLSRLLVEHHWQRKIYSEIEWTTNEQ